METIQWRSDFKVGLVQNAGGDESVIRAMLVASDNTDPEEWSFIGEQAVKNTGRIGSMMRERHGSPFEHNSLTFYVEAPIMVFREWHRHRIGISINEQSGRYSELPPMFYIPPPERPIVKVDGTKQMDYISEHGTPEQYERMVASYKHANTVAYQEYQAMLKDGIVKEVARGPLPVNIYSKMYWTCNARSLMSFLSLRVRVDQPLYEEVEQPLGHERLYRKVADKPTAMFQSKPQWEINQCALMMEEMAEECFKSLFPVTYNAFIANGRVAP